MGKYRFIAIDVDGTLLDDNDKFDVNRLNQDIELLQRQNYHFIIASGNSYDALSTIFQPCPLVKRICSRKWRTTDSKRQICLRQDSFNCDTATALCFY